jgi:hypothetical protein
MQSIVTILLSLAVSSVFGLPQQGPNPPASIDAKFKARGKKYFGVCTDIKLLRDNPKNAEIVAADFGAVTPENRSVRF